MMVRLVWQWLKTLCVSVPSILPWGAHATYFEESSFSPVPEPLDQALSYFMCTDTNRILNATSTLEEVIWKGGTATHLGQGFYVVSYHVAMDPACEPSVVGLLYPTDTTRGVVSRRTQRLYCNKSLDYCVVQTLVIPNEHFTLSRKAPECDTMTLYTAYGFSGERGFEKAGQSKGHIITKSLSRKTPNASYDIKGLLLGTTISFSEGGSSSPVVKENSFIIEAFLSWRGEDEEGSEYDASGGILSRSSDKAPEHSLNCGIPAQLIAEDILKTPLLKEYFTSDEESVWANKNPGDYVNNLNKSLQ